MAQKYQHPITPPPRLVEELQDLGNLDAIQLAYRFGADHELEACCEWLEQNCGRWDLPAAFRAARRPKPPSLKELALALLQPGEPRLFNSEMQDTIRRALEALPND